MKDGFSADEIMNVLQRASISKEWSADDLKRARALKAISSGSYRVVNGVATLLQVSRALCEIH